MPPPDSSPSTSHGAVQLSVVLATYNRGRSLKLLLDDLASQSLDKGAFEVVVVDDGSKEPVAPIFADYRAPYALTFLHQQNAGAAAARDRGVRAARADIVVITDDDMRLVPDFLEQHLRAHNAGASVVLGQIASSGHIDDMPVFERFHAHQLERFIAQVQAGKIQPRGVHVCTGNVSFRRSDYLALGGFDRTLGRSEDRELGVRLEKNGAKLAFCPGAISRHESDHTDLKVWLKRAHAYGVYDHRIAQKHPEVENADPWRFFFLVSPVSRPLLLAAVISPRTTGRLTQLAMRAAMRSDALGYGKLAIFGTTLAYGIEYFRGMRDDAGSLSRATSDLQAYLRKRKRVTHQGAAR